MINPVYYDSYIDRVRDKEPLKVLEDQMNSTQDLFTSISDEKGNFAYAEGKWTIKELIGHLIDSERVFGYRALRFARGDKTELPGFEQDDYVAAADFSKRSLSDLAEEFYLVRKSNLLLFKSFSEEELSRTGIANDGEVSVEALLHIIAGHENHHINVIKEKYLD
jgi:uncharacterized damage-inducible protein DinB